MSYRAWIAFFFLSLSACGPNDPLHTSFKGQWTHTIENGLTGEKTEQSISVIADGERFRTVSTGTTDIVTEVYDGQTLFTTHKLVSGVTDLSAPPDTQELVPADKLVRKRFWAHAWMNGDRQPGGTVAGQETVLYKTRDRRPDGEIGVQEWVDAHTGLLLRSMTSMYSSQAQSVLNQESWECQSITYASVNSSAFQKP